MQPGLHLAALAIPAPAMACLASKAPACGSRSHCDAHKDIAFAHPGILSGGVTGVAGQHAGAVRHELHEM